MVAVEGTFFSRRKFTYETTMKHTFLLLLLIFSATPSLRAQRSVTEYTPGQRAALQEFITKNPGYQFIPDTWFEEATLKAARNEWGFGKNFKPYYQVGDFNRDGLRDFAVILITGKHADDPKSGMHVVVFNGASGNKYRVAHIEHEDFNTATFISIGGKRLYVGIMETDSAGCFVPAGRGYIVEPCGSN